jgi:hypothetical protein
MKPVLRHNMFIIMMEKEIYQEEERSIAFELFKKYRH